MNKKMVTIILFLLFFLLGFHFSQAQVLTMSSMRFDELRLTMPLDSVNKVLGTRLQVKESQWQFSTDTLWTVYKGDSVRLVFERIATEKNKVECTLQNIYSTGKSIQTKSGVKYGDNKFDLVRKLDGSTLKISPDWNFDQHPNKKLFSSVVLYDYTNYSLIIFHFYNNALYGFECAYTPDTM
jgi:hypothetical protein